MKAENVDRLITHAVWEVGFILDDFVTTLDMFIGGLGGKLDKKHITDKFRAEMNKYEKQLIKYENEETDNDKGRQNQAEGD